MPAKPRHRQGHKPPPTFVSGGPDSKGRAPEDIVDGLRSGLALFARRRQDIVRIVHTAAVGPEIHELVRWANASRVSCAEVASAEIDRFAGSAHHEGLCVVARRRPWLPASDLADLLVRQRGTAIALDRVRNPYNVGAILRCAAFFGVEAFLNGAPAPHPELSPIAVRVAEGGVEHLQCSRTTDLGNTLSRLRARGVHVIGADAHSGENVRGFSFVRPTVLVVGHEREGLSDRVRSECEAFVAVRGTGAIESLNVAVAAGVLLGELTRLTA
jgi:TrmH RNA methyltransferase